MSVNLTVPPLGESITEAVVGKWHKKPGEAVQMDEPVVVLETDKVTVDVPAPESGSLNQILAAEGAKVRVGEVLGTIAEAAVKATRTAAARAPPPPAPVAGRARRVPAPP